MALTVALALHNLTLIALSKHLNMPSDKKSFDFMDICAAITHERVATVPDQGLRWPPTIYSTNATENFRSSHRW